MSEQTPTVWVWKDGHLVLAAPRVWKDGQVKPVRIKRRPPA